MAAWRFLITAHFLACRAAITCSLDCFSATTCARERSSSKKFLLERENNFCLALRAWNQSDVPNQVMSKAISGRLRVSQKNLAPTSIGEPERGEVEGRPLTLRFNSLARLLHSSTSFACIASIAARGVGGLSFPRTNCTREFILCLSFLFEGSLLGSYFFLLCF